jgi:deoxycytidylate deaminase
VIDGIRNLGEIKGVREGYTRSFVIGVVATKDVRWRRVQGDYDKNFKIFERDDARDSDEDHPAGQQVQKCVLASDYVLLNEEDLGSTAAREARLYAILGPAIDLMRGTANRYPTADESNMATAHAQSHNSRCLKRYVGAVIVDDKGIPLSLGYNENPVHMKPCVHEFGYCFKDANLEEKLERMENLFCPHCGTKNQKLDRDSWKCVSCGEDFKAVFFPSRNMELCTAIHAEDRAIKSLGHRSAEGATMYATTFPCFQCARHIIDAKIARLVYVEPYPVKEANDFLEKHGVKVEPFQGFMARSFNLLFQQVG